MVCAVLCSLGLVVVLTLMRRRHSSIAPPALQANQAPKKRGKTNKASPEEGAESEGADKEVDVAEETIEVEPFKCAAINKWHDGTLAAQPSKQVVAQVSVYAVATSPD